MLLLYILVLIDFDEVLTIKMLKSNSKKSKIPLLEERAGFFLFDA